MVDKIEMSLDDIIKSQKGMRRGGVNNKGGPRNNRRGGGGGGGFRSNAQRSSGGGGGARTLKGGPRGGIQRSRNSRGDVNSAWKHDMYDGAKKNRLSTLGPAKLLVANLDFGVSESDINELFADFGPLKSASVHYDRSGRSLGTADVIFERRADAIKAMKQYNGVPLDGRPMSIQMATSEIPQPRTQMRSAPASRSPRRNSSFGGGRGNPPRRGGGGSGSSGGRTGGRTNRDRETKTAEELDAELDAYTKDMK